MKELSNYLAEEKFYKTVVEDGSDIIFIVDYDANIAYHNPSVKKTMGYESLTGKYFFDFINPKQLKSVKRLFKESTNLPYNANIEFEFLCSSGKYKYLEFNSINLKHKDGIDALILDCRDISGRKKDQEELIEAQKAKAQFLANMSHEIRTPVNGIAGMVNLLTNTMQSKEQSKYLNAIKHSADNLKVIINDILDYSVIESGKVSLERIGFDIDYQVKSVIDSLELQASEKKLKINYVNKKSNVKILLGDPVRLSQILINLINNAIKFTSEGEISLSMSCRQDTDTMAIAQFEVKDTGIGISENKLVHIFDTFKQADESITRKYGGTGLGLAISKQLVEMQGGSIGVSSKVNKGTLFFFSIPYEIGSEIDLIHKPNESKNGYQKLNKEKFEGIKILLVEDNDINRLYASTILRKWNCTCDEAVNGEIALELLRKNDYDLILMDVHMPVMDGLEATRIIRKSFDAPKKDIPIIAFTANAIKGEKEDYLDIGMNDYISKPFIPDELHTLISKYYLPTSSKEEKPIFAPPYANLTYLKSISDGNKEFLQEIITTFIAQTPSLLDEMKLAVTNKNWLKIGILAHKLKPNLTLLGISQLSALVLSIEVDGRSENKVLSLPDRVDLLVSTCYLSIEELKQYT
ncbi:MAG: ATP-binding protein [Cyclobacteriaceae bacterium]|nr:ATP-binding protein [Cyclobacteriaceae bacterium]